MTPFIDAIVSGGLCHARCAESDDHNCVVVWSGNAEEQLQALALSFAKTEAVEERRAKDAYAADLGKLRAENDRLRELVTLWWPLLHDGACHAGEIDDCQEPECVEARAALESEP